MIYALFGLPFGTVQDIGWTLVHFIWQGLALAAALQLVLPLCKSPVARHNWSVITVAAMAVAPLATFLIIHTHGNTAAPLGAIAESTSQSIGGIAPEFTPIPLPESIPISWAEGLVMFWFAGIAVLSVRAVGGWYVAESLRRRGTFPISPDLLQRCRLLQQRLAISTPIQFLQSRQIRGLAVVGWFRPAILIPVSAITGLSPQYLDALIAHELAHIRRFDAFTNLLLIAAETVLFYHPAVWWVSRRVRIEREHCCDDIAVSLCDDATVYVEALTMIAAWKAIPALALAANSGKLKERAARLLGIAPETRRFSLLAMIGGAFLGLLAAACAITHTQNSAVHGVVALDPKQFDKFVGSYQLGLNTFVVIFRDGDNFMSRRIGQWDMSDADKITFNTYLLGDIAGLVIHPPNGYERFRFNLDSRGNVVGLVLDQNGNERPAKKVAGSPARSLEAAIEWRIKNNTPSPGTETFLHHFIDAMQMGRPNYDEMITSVAARQRQRAFIDVPRIQNLGDMKALTFVQVNSQGMDVYRATFDMAVAEFVISPIAQDGKIRSLGWKVVPFTSPVAEQRPSPGVEEALRHQVEALENGQPDYEAMTPTLVAALQEQKKSSSDLVKKWGPLKSVAFRGAYMPMGERYDLHFEHAEVSGYILPLTSDGKIPGLYFRDSGGVFYGLP